MSERPRKSKNVKRSASHSSDDDDHNTAEGSPNGELGHRQPAIIGRPKTRLPDVLTCHLTGKTFRVFPIEPNEIVSPPKRKSTLGKPHTHAKLRSMHTSDARCNIDLLVKYHKWFRFVDSEERRYRPDGKKPKQTHRTEPREQIPARPTRAACRPLSQLPTELSKRKSMEHTKSMGALPTVQRGLRMKNEFKSSANLASRVREPVPTLRRVESNARVSSFRTPEDGPSFEHYKAAEEKKKDRAATLPRRNKPPKCPETVHTVPTTQPSRPTSVKESAKKDQAPAKSPGRCKGPFDSSSTYSDNEDSSPPLPPRSPLPSKPKNEKKPGKSVSSPEKQEQKKHATSDHPVPHGDPPRAAPVKAGKVKTVKDNPKYVTDCGGSPDSPPLSSSSDNENSSPHPPYPPQKTTPVKSKKEEQRTTPKGSPDKMEEACAGPLEDEIELIMGPFTMEEAADAATSMVESDEDTEWEFSSKDDSDYAAKKRSKIPIVTGQRRRRRDPSVKPSDEWTALHMDEKSESLKLSPDHFSGPAALDEAVNQYFYRSRIEREEERDRDMFMERQKGSYGAPFKMTFTFTATFPPGCKLIEYYRKLKGKTHWTDTDKEYVHALKQLVKCQLILLGADSASKLKSRMSMEKTFVSSITPTGILKIQARQVKAQHVYPVDPEAVLTDALNFSADLFRDKFCEKKSKSPSQSTPLDVDDSYLSQLYDQFASQAPDGNLQARFGNVGMNLLSFDLMLDFLREKAFYGDETADSVVTIRREALPDKRFVVLTSAELRYAGAKGDMQNMGIQTLESLVSVGYTKMILSPFVNGTHWLLLIIDVESMEFRIYDPFQSETSVKRPQKRKAKGKTKPQPNIPLLPGVIEMITLVRARLSDIYLTQTGVGFEDGRAATEWLTGQEPFFIPEISPQDDLYNCGPIAIGAIEFLTELASDAMKEYLATGDWMSIRILHFDCVYDHIHPTRQLEIEAP